MLALLLVLATAASLPSRAHAGAIVATVYDALGAVAPMVISIDPATGAYTPIAAGPGPSDRSGTRSSYDAANGIMYLQTSAQNSNQILAINVATGAASTRTLPDLSAPSQVYLDAFEFDPVSGRILATMTDASAHNRAISIDPATGAYTVIGPGGLAGAHDGTRSTYDAANRIMYYQTGFTAPNQVLAMDYATGAITVLTLPDLSAPSQVYLDAFEFDPVSGRILATMTDASAHNRAISIDPATGAYTVVGPGGLAGAHDGTRSTYDAANRIMYYQTEFMASNQFRAMDYATGAITTITLPNFNGAQLTLDAFEYVADAAIPVPEPPGVTIFATALVAGAALLRRRRAGPGAPSWRLGR